MPNLVQKTHFWCYDTALRVYVFKMLYELLSFLQRMSLPYPTNFAMIDDEFFLGNYPDVIFDPSGICDNEVVCSYIYAQM